MGQEKRLRLRVFSQADSQRVHRAALQILQDPGVAVRDAETCRMLKDAGCRESGDGYMRFDEDLVQKTLLSVPRRMVLYDRNGKEAVATDAPDLRCCPGLNSIDVLDYKTGQRRSCLLDDITKTARVCDLLPNLHMAASLGNPSDVAFDEQALAAVRTMVAHTRKPIAFIAHDEVEAERMWGFLSEVAGGWQQLAAKPFALDLTGPTSPLKLEQEACRRLRLAAVRRLPVVCYPCLFPGMTGPMTLAGALAQSGAEVLAGLVVHQLAGPGAPVISGSAVLPMDMRTVNLAYGSPEYALVSLAAVDYFSDIGVPSWIGAGCSDAHLVDHQAAAEAGANIQTAVLAGTSFIHNLGYLSSGKTGSLEMLVLCDEIIGMTAKLAGGIEVGDKTLALTAVRDSAKTEKYLTHPHTRQHVRTEMWIPSLFQRFTQNTWRQAGSKTISDRIREKLSDMLGQ